MSIKRKAVFIDKDGTLIIDIPYNIDPEKIVLSDDCLTGLKKLQDEGYLLVIVSNQSGIARGYFREEALIAVETQISAMLAPANIRLDGFYYCPHHPDGIIEPYVIACECRKPQPGMLIKAADELDIDLSASWMIGDILNDIEAGNKAGCKSILIDNGNETEWVMNDRRLPAMRVKNINEAAGYILNQQTNNWKQCKNILCIRPDNMGDLIMTGPALRALKESFGCKITVLTSSMAAGIAKLMPEVDDVMVFDVPWVKSDFAADAEGFNTTVSAIHEKQFDAVVVFTVYSQNPLPTVMLAYLAGIPKRLAYCRENPYQLLTDWVPDREPYSLIKHQVRRDLDLVATIGAITANDQLGLKVNNQHTERINQILTGQGIDILRPWLIFHPGVSEAKREYPVLQWAAAGKELIRKGYQIVLTGASSEKQLCGIIHRQIGGQSINAAGLFNLEEFVALVNRSPVVVSVNTGTVHIATAVNTPVIVLYALTNPQHTPWKVPCKVLPFPVPVEAQSRNEVIRHVNIFLYSGHIETPDGKAVACAAQELLDPDLSGANSEPVIIGLPHHKPC